jgi:hypothetical protein
VVEKQDRELCEEKTREPEELIDVYDSIVVLRVSGWGSITTIDSFATKPVRSSFDYRMVELHYQSRMRQILLQ